MAVQWQWNAKMGKATIKRKKHNSEETYKFDLSIYAGSNCAAVFLYEFTETDENGKKHEKYNFWTFLDDKKHVGNLIKNKCLFDPGIVSAKLNLYYHSEALLALDYFTRLGVKVKCYYKEPKSGKQSK